MKTLTSILIALTVALLLAFPAVAQQNGVMLNFVITVQDQPCPNATYWGVVGVPDSEGFGVQLTDSDGDGVYTGSTSWAGGGALFIRLVQGTGRQQVPLVPEPLPGEPSVTIKDFGLVTPTQDLLFEASVAGCPVRLPDTGDSNILPLAPIAAAGIMLAVGAYLRRRVWRGKPQPMRR